MIWETFFAFDQAYSGLRVIVRIGKAAAVTEAFTEVPAIRLCDVPGMGCTLFSSLAATKSQNGDGYGKGRVTASIRFREVWKQDGAAIVYILYGPFGKPIQTGITSRASSGE